MRGRTCLSNKQTNKQKTGELRRILIDIDVLGYSTLPVALQLPQLLGTRTTITYILSNLQENISVSVRPARGRCIMGYHIPEYSRTST